MTVSDGIPNELSDYHQKDPSCSLPGLPQTLFFSIATPITTSAVWSCPFVLQLVSLYNCCFLILLITPSNGVDRAGQGGKGAFHSHRGKRFLGTRQGGHSHSQALVVLGRKHPSGPMGLNLSSQWETEKKKRLRDLGERPYLPHISSWEPPSHGSPHCSHASSPFAHYCMIALNPPEENWVRIESWLQGNALP